MFSDLLIRARALFRRAEMERELDDELVAHLEAETSRHIQAGWPPDEARRRAVLEFGGVEQAREACRDARGVAALETVIRDIRYACRVLRREPGFSATVIMTLALGIGATTAVFGVVNAVLLAPLPFPVPERIVFPWRIAPPGMDLGMAELPWGRPDFLAFAGRTQTLEHIGAFLRETMNLTGAGEATRLEAVKVSAGFLPALGVEPQRGRHFRPDEDRQGSARTILLSDRIWRERFSADAGVLGRTLILNGEPHTVIGIMPAGFTFPSAAGMPSGFSLPRETEVWVPLALSTAPPVRGEPAELAVIGRLRAGVTSGQAQAELDLFARQMERLNPRATGWYNTRVTSMTAQIAGGMRRPLWLLLAAVGVVLVVTCSNIANLLLTRSVARAGELSLRSALGAGRGRLLQQLLTESLVLAMAGGVLGVAVAYVAVTLVKAFGPSSIPRLSEAAVNPEVLGAATLVTLVSALLFGGVPAIVAVRDEPPASQRGAGSPSASTRTSVWVRGTLLVAEVALAVVLVTASSLLTTTFAHLAGEDGGFNADRVLTFELTLPSAQYPARDQMVAYYQRVIEALRRTPGVEQAGLGEILPLDGNGESTGLRVPDLRIAEGDPPPMANYTIVSEGYFAALGTPIRRGRPFTQDDRADSLPAVIVNEAFARTYWPGQDPIGKRVGVPIDSHDMTVVGVVADIKHVSMRDKVSPEVYVPFTQKPWPSMQTMHFAVRANMAPVALVANVREAVAGVDAQVPLARVAALERIVDHSLAQPRFAMLLVGGFGALTVLLSALGLYGTVAYTVAGRAPEIGVRLALGASPRSILRLALGRCLRLTAIGLVSGLGMAVGLLGILSRFLYGVEPTDPSILFGVAALLFVVSVVACYLPARRALRIDPLQAIRVE